MNNAYDVMVIRKANMGDLAQIEHCIDQAYVGYIPRIGKKPASMETNFELLITDGSVWVLELETIVIGLMVLIENTDFLEVRSVAVLPAYQRKGFGRRLMAYAENLSHRKRFRALRLYTNAALPELVSYYETIGYREEKRENDNGYDRVFMVKELKDG